MRLSDGAVIKTAIREYRTQSHGYVNISRLWPRNRQSLRMLLGSVEYTQHILCTEGFGHCSGQLLFYILFVF